METLGVGARAGLSALSGRHVTRRTPCPAAVAKNTLPIPGTAGMTRLFAAKRSVVAARSRSARVTVCQSGSQVNAVAAAPTPSTKEPSASDRLEGEAKKELKTGALFGRKTTSEVLTLLGREMRMCSAQCGSPDLHMLPHGVIPSAGGAGTRAAFPEGLPFLWGEEAFHPHDA